MIIIHTEFRIEVIPTISVIELKQFFFKYLNSSLMIRFPISLHCKISDYWKYLYFIGDYWKYIYFIDDYWKYLYFISDYWKYLYFIGDYWKYLCITGDYWKHIYFISDNCRYQL